MKRKPLYLALALMFVVGAALLGVNYRLNNPPLSDADKEFRAMVVGADEVRASQWGCQQQMWCTANPELKYKPLNAAQTRQLIDRLRFVSKVSNPPVYSGITSQPLDCVHLDLDFRRGGKSLAVFTLLQTKHSSELSQYDSKSLTALVSSKLNPRLERPLRRTLDEVLPRHIKPK